MDIQTLPLGAFQLAVMIGAEVTYHPFFRLRVMKYWSSIWLTDGRLPEAGHRPDIIHKIDDRPFTRLHQHHSGRPHTELALSQDVVSGCRNRERWADTHISFPG